MDVPSTVLSPKQFEEQLKAYINQQKYDNAQDLWIHYMRLTSTPTNRFKQTLSLKEEDYMKDSTLQLALDIATKRSDKKLFDLVTSLMKSRQMIVDVSAYQSMIEALLKLNRQEDAIRYVGEIRQQHKTLPVAIYELFIEYSIRAGDVAQAFQSFHRIFLEGTVPSVNIATLLLAAFDYSSAPLPESIDFPFVQGEREIRAAQQQIKKYAQVLGIPYYSPVWTPFEKTVRTPQRLGGAGASLNNSMDPWAAEALRVYKALESHNVPLTSDFYYLLLRILFSSPKTNYVPISELISKLLENPPPNVQHSESPGRSETRLYNFVMNICLYFRNLSLTMKCFHYFFRYHIPRSSQTYSYMVARHLLFPEPMKVKVAKAETSITNMYNQEKDWKSIETVEVYFPLLQYFISRSKFTDVRTLIARMHKKGLKLTRDDLNRLLHSFHESSLESMVDFYLKEADFAGIEPTVESFRIMASLVVKHFKLKILPLIFVAMENRGISVEHDFIKELIVDIRKKSATQDLSHPVDSHPYIDHLLSLLTSAKKKVRISPSSLISTRDALWLQWKKENQLPNLSLIKGKKLVIRKSKFRVKPRRREVYSADDYEAQDYTSATGQLSDQELFESVMRVDNTSV